MLAACSALLANVLAPIRFYLMQKSGVLHHLLHAYPLGVEKNTFHFSRRSCIMGAESTCRKIENRRGQGGRSTLRRGDVESNAKGTEKFLRTQKKVVHDRDFLRRALCTFCNAYV